MQLERPAIYSGKVTYGTQPSVEIAENEVLICGSLAAKGTNAIIWDL